MKRGRLNKLEGWGRQCNIKGTFCKARDRNDNHTSLSPRKERGAHRSSPCPGERQVGSVHDCVLRPAHRKPLHPAPSPCQSRRRRLSSQVPAAAAARWGGHRCPARAPRAGVPLACPPRLAAPSRPGPPASAAPVSTSQEPPGEPAPPPQPAARPRPPRPGLPPSPLPPPAAPPR